MQSKLLLIFFLGSFISFSQLPVWPTSNAEWYYTHSNGWDSDGCTHYIIDRDTVINLKTYQIYSRQLDWVLDMGTVIQSGSTYSDNFFIIGVEDSLITYYNEMTEQIDTLMNFKAQVGDKWKNHMYKQNCNDNGEFIITEVLAISSELVDGVLLMKYRLHRYSEDFSWNVDYEEDFYQMLGSKESNFVPESLCTATDIPVDGSVRCFNYHLGESDELTYKNWLGECDYVEGLGLKEAQNLDLKVSFKNDVIQIDGRALGLLNNLHLFNSIGSEVPFKIIHQSETSWILNVEDVRANDMICLRLIYQDKLMNFKLIQY